MDEDFLASLPSEPELAFSRYEEQVRKELGERDQNGWGWKSEYVQYIEAFVTEYSFEIPNLPDRSLLFEDVSAYYQRYLEAVGVRAKQSLLARAKFARSAIAPAYIFTAADKAKIHHHINQVRAVIASANLTAQKRDALSNRLNAFANEVDRDRTRLDALTSFYFFAKKEAKEELKGAYESIERIFEIIETAKEWLGLPDSDKPPQLPRPPRQIEGPKKKNSEDDEIPF